jgi:hypothetical protein
MVHSWSPATFFHHHIIFPARGETVGETVIAASGTAAAQTVPDDLPGKIRIVPPQKSVLILIPSGKIKK